MYIWAYAHLCVYAYMHIYICIHICTYEDDDDDDEDDDDDNEDKNSQTESLHEITKTSIDDSASPAPTRMPKVLIEITM